MASCAIDGGCPTDYIAIFLRLLSWTVYFFLVHKVPRINGSGAFWIPVIQIIASFNLLLSIVMSVNLLKFSERHWLQSCYIWGGPLGFGLLLSSRITQAFQLYYIFVKRRLPPIKSYVFLPLILLPWIAAASFIHVMRPVNDQCHMGVYWIIPIVFLHTSYVASLTGFAGAIRHIEFRFDELKDLWKGVVVSALSIVVWVDAYILNEVHDDILWLQVASRFVLLLTVSILVLAFFSISSSQPLLSQISLRKREPLVFDSMGQALGIPESGLLMQRDPNPVIDPNEPLDKLLLNKKFRQSFMAFADSCLAGESVHFYNEVYERSKIPVEDTVRRIYMTRHIIEKYIASGATMEVNISYRTRQEILNTSNLSHPNLFDKAINELLQLMKTVPLYVATKMASIKRSSFFVPSTTGYARAGLHWIGYEPRCTPYWPHSLIWGLLTILPESAIDKWRLGFCLNIRKRGQQKDSRKKA